MALSWKHRTFALVTFLGAACGGSPPTPTSPAGTVPPEETKAPNLAEVPEPAELLFWAHVENPAETLPLLDQLSPNGVPALAGFADLVQTRLGPDVAADTDLGSALDVAVSAEGTVVSVGLKGDYQPPKTPPKPAHGPASRFTRRSDGDLDFRLANPEGADHACRIMRAAGPRRYRLACAKSLGSLDQLAPWLARSAPRIPTSPRVQVQVTKSAITAVTSAIEERLAEIKASTPSEAVGSAIVKEGVVTFVHDLDRVSLTLDTGKALEVRLESTLRKPQSLINHVLLGHPEAPEPLPAAFWKLPPADQAFYLQGTSVERVRTVGEQFLRKAIEADDDALEPQQVDRFVHAVNDAVLRGGPVLVATGAFEPDHGRAILTRELPNYAKPSTQTTIEDGLASWMLVYRNEPASVLKPAFRELVRVASTEGPRKRKNRPGPTAGTGNDATGKSKDEPRSLMRWTEVPTTSETGPFKDCAHWDLRDIPNPQYAPKTPEARPKLTHPTSTHMLLCPDGGGSWIALSPSLDRLRPLVRDTIAGSNPRPRGLEALKDHRGSAGGYLTLFGPTTMGASAEKESDARASLAILDLLAALPHQGKSRLPIRIIATPQTEQLVKLSIQLAMPPEFLTDFIAFYGAQAPKTKQ